MALVRCPECGKEISDQAFICPNCGHKKNPVKIIKCPECGNTITDIGDNCPYCGYPLNHGLSEVNFFKRELFTIIMLLFFWPVGLFCMWKNEHFSLMTRCLISILALLFAAIMYRNLYGPISF